MVKLKSNQNDEQVWQHDYKCNKLVQFLTMSRTYFVETTTTPAASPWMIVDTYSRPWLDVYVHIVGTYIGQVLTILSVVKAGRRK